MVVLDAELSEVTPAVPARSSSELPPPRVNTSTTVTIATTAAAMVGISQRGRPFDGPLVVARRAGPAGGGPPA